MPSREAESGEYPHLATYGAPRSIDLDGGPVGYIDGRRLSGVRFVVLVLVHTGAGDPDVMTTRTGAGRRKDVRRMGSDRR